MQISSVVAALAYAGVGAGVGTIGAAIVQSRSGKGEARAHAADLLAEGYGGFADRLSQDNKAKTTEIKALRTVLLKLTDGTDVLLDAMDSLLDHSPNAAASKAISRAREANRVAKLAL